MYVYRFGLNLIDHIAPLLIILRKNDGCGLASFVERLVDQLLMLSKEY